jgi:anti-sigma factor RsiW
VRERVFRALARARSQPSRSSRALQPAWWAALAAVAVALTLVTGVWLGERTASPPDPIVAFVDEHVRAVKGEGIASPDSLSVARWLASRLPFRVEIPLFPESQLRGARLCLMDGRRGAAIEYDVRGQALSYYVIAYDSGKANDLPGRIRHAGRTGYRVVAWHASGLTHAIVGGLPESRLTALAHYCMKHMVALLARATALGFPPTVVEAL